MHVGYIIPFIDFNDRPNVIRSWPTTNLPQNRLNLKTNIRSNEIYIILLPIALTRLFSFETKDDILAMQLLRGQPSSTHMLHYLKRRYTNVCNE